MQDLAQLFSRIRLASHRSQALVTNDDDCQEVEDLLVGLRHYRLISVRQERLLARRDPFERKASKLIEHPRPA